MEEGQENKDNGAPVLEAKPVPQRSAAEMLSLITGADTDTAKAYVEANIKVEEKKPEAEKKPEDNKEEEKVEEEEEIIEEKEEKKDDATEKKAEKAVEKGNEDNEDAEESMFFGKKKAKQEEVKVESFDQVAQLSKKTLGFEVKDFKDMPKMFSAIEKIRAEAQRASELQTEASGLRDVLENLPEDLLDSVKAYYNGEDYKKPLESPKFDFSKPADKQDVKSLVSHFFPDKFKQEDFEDLENPSPAMEIAIQASQDKFESMKKAYDDKRASMVNQERDKLAAKKASIEGSVNHLKEQFPDLPSKAFSEVKQMLEGDLIMSLFYNKDGSFNSQAAERAMLAKYGKDEIARLVKAAEYQTETRVNEEIVTRGADKKKPRSGGGSGEEKLSTKAKEFLDSTVGGLGKKPTY